MEAKERSFVFMRTASYYDIPFFQRAYVWDEDNWTELLNNFFDHTDSHFLGSIILKQEQVSAGDTARFMVIDGQQRLTTLSILLRACYDRLMEDASKYEKGVVDSFETVMHSLLFIKPDIFSLKEDVKINHSKLDKPYYQKVINGELSDSSKQIKKPSKIERCYLFFREELHNRDDRDIESLWKLLTTDNSKFLVNIDLGANENEQKIFDTVNSYGVRLSSSDTIKNSLFQYYIDSLRQAGETDVDKAASDLYDQTWGKAFTSDDETSAYWSATKRYGRLTRDNIEVMLHAFAVIKGFFDPAVDNTVNLAQKYKDFTKNMDRAELEEFLYSLEEYAEIYRKYFGLFDNETLLSFDDYRLRLLHLCYALDVATFYPYILKLLYQNEKGEISEEVLKSLFLQLERYIVLNAVCGGSTKNYNNECVQLVRERRTPEELQQASDGISRRSFDEGLRRMRNNKIPTAVLFWVELYDRSTKYSDISQLKYNYTLEHIMPQKWVDNWSIQTLPVYSENGYLINDPRDAAEERSAAVYEIGNMTLLNSRLNTALSNNTFNVKINGDGKKYKNCVRQLADLYLTKEIIDEPSWDERNIRRRTADLEKRIEQIWDIEFAEDKPIHLDFDSDDPQRSFDETFFEGTEYKDILYTIERSDLSDDNKKRYREYLLDDILSHFYGDYSYHGEKRLFAKETREVIESICDSTSPLFVAALIAADDGDRDKCIENYKKMFEAGENNEKGVSEEDFFNYALIPVKDAIPGFYSEFIKSIEQIPVEPFVKDLCGVLDEFYEEDDLDDIIDLLSPVLGDYPDNTNLNAIVGDAYYSEKMWAAAIEHLEKCVDKEDLLVLEETDLLDKLSYALQKDSPRYSLKDSIVVCEKLLDIEPNANILARLGHAQYMLNRFDEAIETFKKCIEIDAHISAANDLAKAYAFSGRVDELRTFIENPPVPLRKYTMEIAERALSERSENGNK